MQYQKPWISIDNNNTTNNNINNTANNNTNNKDNTSSNRLDQIKGDTHRHWSSQNDKRQIILYLEEVEQIFPLKQYRKQQFSGQHSAIEKNSAARRNSVVPLALK